MKIKVTKNQVILKEGYIVNRGEYNVNPLEFEFSEEYTDDLIKKAVFVRKNDDPIEVTIHGDTCTIPIEMLSEKEFDLRIYAYEEDNGNLILRYSPTYAVIYTREGSYITDGGGGGQGGMYVRVVGTTLEFISGNAGVERSELIIE